MKFISAWNLLSLAKFLETLKSEAIRDEWNLSPETWAFKLQKLAKFQQSSSKLVPVLESWTDFNLDSLSVDFAEELFSSEIQPRQHFQIAPHEIINVLVCLRSHNVMSRERRKQQQPTKTISSSPISVDMNDSSWRWADSRAPQCLWPNSTQTSAFPRSEWKSLCRPARSCPGRRVRKRPRTAFVLSPRGCSEKVMGGKLNHFFLFPLRDLSRQMKNSLGKAPPHDTRVGIHGGVSHRDGCCCVGASLLLQVGVIPK